jgi:uncharacterized protein
MNIVQLNQVPAQPWRNGGGSTRELLAWPAAQRWQLRVSLASIEQDGAFSVFDGVQRWFAVVDGAGVALALPGGAAMQKPGDAPLSFDGAAAPMCQLLDGPTSDLNLMVKQGSGVALMRLAQPGDEGAGPARWRGIFVADDAVLNIQGSELPLQAGSLLWSDVADRGTWQLRHAGRAWWMALQAP